MNWPLISPVTLDIIILAQSQVWFKIGLAFKNNRVFLSPNELNPLILSESLIHFIGAFNIEARPETSLRNRLPIHFSNYWWAGINNYVYSTISVITKVYVFLLYFASVSLLMMRNQPASIAWAVTSAVTFYHCWHYTKHSVLWIR